MDTKKKKLEKKERAAPLDERLDDFYLSFRSSRTNRRKDREGEC